MKLLGLVLLCVGAASAQSISVGVVGGVPFSDAVNSVQTGTVSYLPKSTNFIVGPALQVNLPASLRIEVDALYRPYSFTVSNLVGDFSASQWQFPFLLQYRFKRPVVKPYVEAGVSFDHLSNISTAAKNITAGTGQLLRQSSAALVIGGGVDVKIPFVRLSGGLRYSHESSSFFSGLSNVNQAEVLVGVHF